MGIFSEKTYHWLFKLGVVLKTIATVVEVVLGFLLFAISADKLNGLIITLIGGELAETPRDFIWKGVRMISPHTEHIWAFIFLSHGIVKLILMTGLIRDKIWAYPAAAAVFSVFIVYQVYTMIYNPSLAIEVLTVFDVIFIALVLQEYRYKKQQMIS